MVYKSGQIFLPFCHNTRVWQTDGRTDRQTEFSSLYRVCITCSAVKTFRQKNWAFSWFLKFWRESDSRIVAGSLFHDAGPAAANAHHQSWSSNVEPGDRRVLPSGVENEQRLQRLIGRAHWDELVHVIHILFRKRSRDNSRSRIKPKVNIKRRNKLRKCTTRNDNDTKRYKRYRTILNKSAAEAEHNHDVTYYSDLYLFDSKNHYYYYYYLNTVE